MEPRSGIQLSLHMAVTWELHRTGTPGATPQRLWLDRPQVRAGHRAAAVQGIRLKAPLGKF